MLSAMASTRFAAALSGGTLDYVVVDTEHCSRDRAEVQQLCAMLRQADITPVVRVPVPKPEWVAMALDAGAAGVLIPYCETVDEVRAVTATARWHPLKGEHLRRAARDGTFPSGASKNYLRRRRRENFTIIGIESEPAYRNLDAILAIGDIDAVFIGPNDLSTSLGVPDDYASPAYLDTVADIIKRCAYRGLPVMVHQQNLPTSIKAIDLGARFVLHSTDAGLLQRVLKAELNALREAAGVAAVGAADKVATV